MTDDQRAFLESLGEPPPHVLQAGAEADAEGSEENARDVWQAMVAALLGLPSDG